MNTRLLALLTIVLSSSFPSVRAEEKPAKTIRAGMIGLDTSHVPAFAKIFNDAKADGELAGIKVVAGYPGGTDIPASRDRVARFTEQLRSIGASATS
jgi:hypothetical protein